MDKVDITIIGAGAIGLAVAEALSGAGKDILVLEKWDSFGRETSSRNSEVIHAGIYYRRDSLKARYCAEGNALLWETCEKNRIPCRKTGKIVIATCPEEVADIERIYENGRQNGAKLERISGARISEFEPQVRGLEGFYSPNSGIFDTHRFMSFLEWQAKEKGVTFAYHSEVTGIARDGQGYCVTVREKSGESLAFLSGAVVNCAGLYADRVAALAGLARDITGYELRYCKGEYFKVSDRHRGRISMLVYPVPTEISLGIHTVIRLDGTFKLGPNAYFVDSVEYSVSENNKREMFEKARRYLPFLESGDLTPDMCGIRPKLYIYGKEQGDFLIVHERERGYPGFINLLGIESPGLTASLSIGGHVKKIFARDIAL